VPFWQATPRRSRMPTKPKVALQLGRGLKHRVRAAAGPADTSVVGAISPIVARNCRVDGVPGRRVEHRAVPRHVHGHQGGAEQPHKAAGGQGVHGVLRWGRELLTDRQAGAYYLYYLCTPYAIVR
jgi:hypothetical protein